MKPLWGLVAKFEARAADLRDCGAEGNAAAVEWCAERTEEMLREWEFEELTIEEAAAELGLTYDAVQRQIADGRLPNAGRTRAPRVLRRDLFPGLFPNAIREGRTCPVLDLAQ